MGRVTLGKYGSARQDEDGDWRFPGRTPAVDTVDEGDVVGFRYTVEGTGEAVRIELSIVFHSETQAAPAPVYEAIDVAPNAGFMKFARLPATFFSDAKPLRATFFARTSETEEPVSASLIIVPAAVGRVFSKTPFAPASEADITAYEARFGMRLQPDYRDFLATVNGADLVWFRAPEWMKSNDAFYRDLNAAERDARAKVGADWEGPRYIFGIGNRHPSIDIAEQGGDFGFYRNELMRHAYLVAEDGGGNNFVQVAQGRHAGRILMVDHEVYYGGLSSFVDFDGLDDEQRADLPWTDFADARTDDVIDKAEEYGFMIPVVDDFATFYARELAVIEAIIEAMAPKYLRS